MTGKPAHNATPIRMGEDGPEKFCQCCPDGGEWWPITDEFWYFANGRPNSPCIACQQESRAKLADRPCCVPGCTNPRRMYTTRVGSRCVEHERELRRTEKVKRLAKTLQAVHS